MLQLLLQGPGHLPEGGVLLGLVALVLVREVLVGLVEGLFVDGIAFPQFGLSFFGQAFVIDDAEIYVKGLELPADPLPEIDVGELLRVGRGSQTIRVRGEKENQGIREEGEEVRKRIVTNFSPQVAKVTSYIRLRGHSVSQKLRY